MIVLIIPDHLVGGPVVFSHVGDQSPKQPSVRPPKNLFVFGSFT